MSKFNNIRPHDYVRVVLEFQVDEVGHDSHGEVTWIDSADGDSLWVEDKRVVSAEVIQRPLGVGDLVTVEEFGDRQFYARYVGPQISVISTTLEGDEDDELVYDTVDLTLAVGGPQ